MYPPRMVLYFYGFLYVFLNYGIQKRIIKKMLRTARRASCGFPDNSARKRKKEKGRTIANVPNFDSRCPVWFRLC